MANGVIAQRTMGDVYFVGSARVGGVGDCARLVPTLGGLGNTSGQQINRIPQARPSWWESSISRIKKNNFFAPQEVSYCSLGTSIERKDTKRLLVAFILLVSYKPLANNLSC